MHPHLAPASGLPSIGCVPAELKLEVVEGALCVPSSKSSTYVQSLDIRSVASVA